MGRRIVSFDLDKALDVAAKLSTEAPSLLQMAAAQGLDVPPSVAKYLPWIGVLANLAGKVFPKDGDTGLSRPGFPDTGPLGRGRATYLRKRRAFDDDAVVTAAAMALDPANDLPGASSVVEMVEYTLSSLFPDASAYDARQKRAAIDQLLEFDVLGQRTADKFGDILWHALNLPKISAPPPTPPTEEKEGDS